MTPRRPGEIVASVLPAVLVALAAIAIIGVLSVGLSSRFEEAETAPPFDPASQGTRSRVAAAEASTAPEDQASSSDVSDPDAITGGWDYYGNPWAPTYLANLPLSEGWRVSYRFEAKHSGVMAGFQNYFTGNVGHAGYASGTGGVIEISLVPDDGSGLPDTSQVLAKLVWRPELSDGLSSAPDVSTSKGHPTHFAEKYWDVAPTLVGGRRYHIVFENVDSDDGNWISLNNPYAVRDIRRGGLAPSVSSWGMTLDTGGGFGENTMREQLDSNGNRYDVNLLILMADGGHFGNSYMEAKDDHLVSGSSKVRQLFSPGVDLAVDQLSIFVGGTGTIRVDLIADDEPIESWTVAVEGELDGGDWSHYLIETEPLVLASDVQYTLEFSADSGSMEMGTYRDGSLGLGKTFARGGSWGDGYAQYSSGDDWTDAFFEYADLTGVAFSLADTANEAPSQP